MPFSSQQGLVAVFDPGKFPVQFPPEKKESGEPTDGIRLGGNVTWSPSRHPNPHVLIVGGSGSGKSWTIRHLATELIRHGYDCVLFDFHGDPAIEGAWTHPISLESEYGVNPLSISFDRKGGGPDPQRFEVMAQSAIYRQRHLQMRSAFRAPPPAPW
jgi:hypothetical protein